MVLRCTMRRTPARAAASTTSRVPPTFTRGPSSSGSAPLKRLAAPGTVEYDVAPSHGRRQRLGSGDVAVHALEADGRRPARKALADERAHRRVTVEQAVDHALADEAVGAGDERASHPGIHAAILP